MNTNVKIGAAIAAVLVLAVVGFNVLPGSPGFGGPGPTASPTGSPDAIADSRAAVLTPRRRSSASIPIARR